MAVGCRVGVFGGRAEVMDHLAPLGAGVPGRARSAGIRWRWRRGVATLDALWERRAELYPQLDRVTGAIADGVAALAARHGVGLTTNRVGSMFTWFFTPEPVTDFASAARSDTAMFGRFHRAMLERGVWLPPSQFEAAFVSAAHGETEVAAILAAADSALHEVLR